jgi:prevent-host-death family protein
VEIKEIPMPKVVSSTKAKAHLGTLLKWIDEHDDEVIVEHYNKPTAVLMTYAEYEEIVKLREQERRRQGLAELQSLRTQMRERHTDLTVEEASQLAGFLAEAMQEMVQASRQTGSAG